MKNKLINAGLIIMLIIGVVLVLMNPIQSFLISRLSTDLVPVEATHETSDTHVSFDFEEVQSLSITDILRAQANQANLPIIGSMTIPAVSLELPILKGVGKEALTVGAGTMKPNQVLGEGNYALASHYFENSAILFGPLYDVKQGDIIYLSDLQYVYTYEISVIEVIEETAVSIINDQPNQTLLTLITCAEAGTKRLAVQAVFKEKKGLDEADV